MRSIVMIGTFALVASLACRGSAKGPPIDTLRARTAAQVAAWDRLTAGRVVARAESRFSVIENDTCPGTRTVTSRFESAADLLVLLVEDNSEVQCTEGIRSKPLVLVWKGGKYFAAPDTIHVYGSALSMVSDPSTDHAAPLVEAYEEGGMMPSTNTYYSIISGQSLFTSQLRTQSFVANGTRRFLGVIGGGGDTAATVAYSTGIAAIQILHIPRDSGSALNQGDESVVDTMDLDGPGRQCCNNILLGANAKDTVPVSGVTLTFTLSNLGIGGGPADGHVSYVVRIVNDRLVLAPSRK